MTRIALVSLFFLATLAVAQDPGTGRREQGVCEHAAPPLGMRWVCTDRKGCDCHLERELDDQGEPGTMPEQKPTAKRVCQHPAPPAGSVLTCDSDCQCTIAASGSATKPCDQPRKKVIEEKTSEDLTLIPAQQLSLGEPFLRQSLRTTTVPS